MKHVIPINTISKGESKCITAHYSKIGWKELMSDVIPATAVLEIEMSKLTPIQVTQIYSQEQNPMNGRVYSEYGISPTLRTSVGGSSEPKIMQISSYSPRSACNAKVLDVNGICPTLLDHKGAEPAVIEPCILGYTRDDKGTVQSYHEKNIAGTLHTSTGQGGNTDQFVKEQTTIIRQRIRKLTPTECFRLMGVDDSDIEKMKSAKIMQTLKNGKVKERPMPKTQLYKMAGNSIVVDVLYHIFYQMFIVEPPKPEPTQLSLFD